MLSRFPFLDIPLLWNWFQDRFGREMPARERAHRDGIKVTSHSAEAFFSNSRNAPPQFSRS
jgi:hypothetical protein